MVEIGDLKRIPEDKKVEVIRNLDQLLTYRDSQGRLSPLICGYNRYDTVPDSESAMVFSNLHETEDYKSDMLADLGRIGYESQDMESSVRVRGTTYLHDPTFPTRDSTGKIFPGLRIRDLKTGKYIQLERFSEPLIKYPEFEDSEGSLVAENSGWEIDIPFRTKRELIRLAKFFVRKSGKHIYDHSGIKSFESGKQQHRRAPWRDAYDVPVVFIGDYIIKHKSDLPAFTRASKVTLKEGGNEISFVVYRRVGVFKSTQNFRDLKELGFLEEGCLINKVFAKYILRMCKPRM